jgi:TusA-related sulfurtransferase
MPITDVQDPIDSQRPVSRMSPIGNWEIHSWGDGAVPGMAVISAITTLQVGATLATMPEDKAAMNEAAEYLKNALAPQLKSFQQRLSECRPSLQRELFQRQNYFRK